jgi:hypothetical protein
MTRIYDNAGFATRANISLAVLVLVIAYGLWELYAAYGGNDPTGGLFGVLFVGGGGYGIYTIFTDNRDLVGALDVDESAGGARLTLWQPFRKVTVEETLTAIAGWRLWTKVGSRSARAYYLLAAAPSHPRPLRFELRRGQTISDGLRRLAPEAIEDFERETRPRPAPGQA